MLLHSGDTDDFGDEDLKVAGPGDNEMDLASSTTTETAEDDTVDAYSDSAGESLSVTSGSNSETEDRPESEEELVLSRPSSGTEEQDEQEADTLEQETLEDTGICWIETFMCISLQEADLFLNAIVSCKLYEKALTIWSLLLFA